MKISESKINYKIFAIVVTFNGSQWIDRCIGSLIDSSIPINILAIDNGSTDGTPDIIRNKYPQVEVIETGENLGFGKANNIGLKMVLSENADYSFLLNQDAWIEKDTIKKMIFSHKLNSDYGVLAPLQFNGEGTLIDSLFLECSLINCREYITNQIIGQKNLDNDNVISTDFVNAACWLLPKETINAIGGFDPLFPHYGEDADYINRVRDNNLKIGICPDLKVYHDRENRTSQPNEAKDINRAYVGNLINLKNSHGTLSAKKHFYKLLFLNFIEILLSGNKRHLRIQHKVIIKILKSYNEIKIHRELEKMKNALYL